MEEESYLYINSRSRSVSSSEEEHDTPDAYLKQFITTYESFPSLWDPTNPKYSNKTIRNEALDKLASILKHLKPHATREDARKKVNSLRSNYRKELMKIQRSKRSGATPDEVYKPTSSTFYMLKFLSYVDKPVSPHGDSDEYGEEKLDKPTVSLQYDSPPPKIRKLAKKSPRHNFKIHQDTIRKKHKELIPKVYPIIQSPVEPTRPIEPIALVWSEKIKNLSPAHRIQVEKAINDILYEAEVQHLNDNPVPTLTIYTPAPHSENPPDLVVSKEER